MAQIDAFAEYIENEHPQATIIKQGSAALQVDWGGGIASERVFETARNHGLTQYKVNFNAGTILFRSE